MKSKKRKEYDPINLENALLAVKSGNMSHRKAALVYGVPQSTIGTRIAKWKQTLLCKDTT